MPNVFTAVELRQPLMQRTGAVSYTHLDVYKRQLQKDWCIIKSNQLSDAFCIAVRGHKGWGGLFKAKYSLAVSFEAINQDIPIYEPIRTEIELAIENGEIEVEMPEHKQ